MVNILTTTIQTLLQKISLFLRVSVLENLIIYMRLPKEASPTKPQISEYLLLSESLTFWWLDYVSNMAPQHVQWPGFHQKPVNQRKPPLSLSEFSSHHRLRFIFSNEKKNHQVAQVRQLFRKLLFKPLQWHKQFKCHFHSQLVSIGVFEVLASVKLTKLSRNIISLSIVFRTNFVRSLLLPHGNNLTANRPDRSKRLSGGLSFTSGPLLSAIILEWSKF